jgi:hypothetical protein
MPVLPKGFDKSKHLGRLSGFQGKTHYGRDSLTDHAAKGRNKADL